MDLATAQVVTGGALVIGVAGFILRWAWTHTHKRIDDTHAEMQRTTSAIFEQMREHDREDRSRHDEVIRVTTRISTQMDRFISDLESEKRTRAEANKEIAVKLERINDRLADRREGDRKGEGSRR